MLARRLLALVAVVFSVARCADQPTTVRPPAAPQFVRWATPSLPQFSASTLLPNANPNSRRALFSPPISLERYSAGFWAVRGETRSIRINYQDAQGGTDSPFLELTITDPVFVPGVGDLAMGDSVYVTVAVDTNRLGVSLEPTGTQFGTPSHLQIWYGGANGDLNADGMVDSVDAYVENQLLGLWYSEAGSDFHPVPAVQSLNDKSFSSEIPHFSVWVLAWVVDYLDWATSW